MKASYSLIVAKYNEDMGWLSKMNPIPIHVYNKGEDTVIHGVRVEKLPNIGRESDSYLRFIIANYDALPDYLLLVQGRPFDHMKGVDADNFQQKIDALISSRPTEIQPLFAEWYIEAHNHFPAIRSREHYEYLFGKPAPTESVFCAGCQYIVPRESILSKPPEFYEQLHARIAKGECTYHRAHYHICPFDASSMDPWTFERLGAYIFGRPAT